MSALKKNINNHKVIKFDINVNNNKKFTKKLGKLKS